MNNKILLLICYFGFYVTQNRASSVSQKLAEKQNSQFHVPMKTFHVIKKAFNFKLL